MRRESPDVHFISEGRAHTSNFAEIRDDLIFKVRNAANFGVNFFQIREKKLSAGLLFELTRAVVAAAPPGVRVLLNERADIALAAGAAGVHLPADGLPASELRKHFPSEFIIGVSAHSVQEAVKARDGGADHVTFAPVFDSPGKGVPRGSKALAEVTSRVAPLPVIGLGGVDRGTIDEVLETGAAGYAAIRYLNELLSGK